MASVRGLFPDIQNQACIISFTIERGTRNMDSEAQASEDHYLRHLTKAGEQRELVTAEAVYNSNGVKLITEGTSVNPALFDKLISHKLLKPIDCSISVRDGVTVRDLLAEGKRLRDESKQFGTLFTNLRDPEAPLRALGEVCLEPALTAKLTVAMERIPTLITHSVSVALCAAALGAHTGQGAPMLKTLATAGLFHDLGQLHIDPGIFTDGHPLTATERRQIDAHPLIAHLLLKRFSEYRPDVSRAVLEHHERLDGSGYPNAINSRRISLAGKFLAVAEFATSTSANNSCAHMITALRLQSSEFDAEAIKALYELWGVIDDHTIDNDETQAETITAWFHLLDQAIAAWDKLIGGVSEQARKTDEVLLVTERLARLHNKALHLGLTRDNVDATLELLSGDPRAIAELAEISHELRYNFKDIIWETRRCCSKNTKAPVGDSVAPVINWCEQMTPLLEQSSIQTVHN